MNQKRAGYSLFEVLIAFAILTIVLSALIPGQARLMSRISQQDDIFLAQDYAYSRLARIGIVTPLEQGQFQDRYRDWVITEKISETQLDDIPAIRLFRISVQIFSRNGKLLVSSESLRVVP